MGCFFVSDSIETMLNLEKPIKFIKWMIKHKR
jgi:hypothetical protein